MNEDVNQIWALPFATMYMIGLFGWPWVTRFLIDDNNWHTILLVRVSWQFINALVLCMVTAINMDDTGWKAIRNFLIGILIALTTGLGPNYESVFDLKDGVLEGKPVSAYIERTANLARYGVLAFGHLQIQTNDDRKINVDSLAGPLELIGRQCRRQGLSFDHAKVLRHLGYILSFHCGSEKDTRQKIREK